jgi:hypothetical protein
MAGYFELYAGNISTTGALAKFDLKFPQVERRSTGSA